ncbi:hypothetical protein TVAG_444820 [Trichomonas vaginalis G3]|uniref:Uncharacterized protein n=1 Tax=Trichomonas vaginalis (strain ATCC PRA-98 / G3) TaxID=412133 RepID=A2FRY0_TRIV3|nr:hypothetical protein TVAGG3_0659480 [Trichomonas vaginalis G3]EAX92346.1 hypothetical protein TVAG_444820 [Trichomonas vaginalis G3]KAI5506403.1 hypothetical protein TVAGG3_0659480 [Trichomonas vaginalis G3]|eukprot:XP_001305276.1 hypothetical protein [Trichomonas vaginalis G3]
MSDQIQNHDQKQYAIITYSDSEDSSEAQALSLMNHYYINEAFEEAERYSSSDDESYEIMT